MINAQDDPKKVGNCVTGKIGFNPTRILNNQVNSSVIDVNKYDLTIDYAASNVMIGPDGVKLVLNRNGNSVAQGTRMSTTRYMLYGKFSVEMSAVPVPGVVVTFITMSERHDEVDW
jgi:beta-glucanase (GH16 family)